MSFSRLLLTAVSSKKYIAGKGNDKVIITPKATVSGNNDPYAGETILFFDLDNPKDQEKRVAGSLGMQKDDKRCDGLIFYAQDEQEEKVICLVEMKSSQIKDAADQIITTRNYMKQLLHEECSNHCNRELKSIKWKACFYHHGASPDDVSDILMQLKKAGFVGYDDFTSANNNIGPLLRDELSAKEMGKPYKHKKRH